MISKILVPTDGSDTARKTVKYACGLAKQTKAKIILLSVIEKSALTRAVPALTPPTRIMAPVEDYLRIAAETYLRDAETVCRRSRIRASTVIRSGHPVEEIIKEARKSKVSLIVMGSRGMSSLTSAVLGGVTFGVMHKDTKFPVLVIRK